MWHIALWVGVSPSGFWVSGTAPGSWLRGDGVGSQAASGSTDRTHFSGPVTWGMAGLILAGSLGR